MVRKFNIFFTHVNFIKTISEIMYKKTDKNFIRIEANKLQNVLLKKIDGRNIAQRII